MFTLRIAVIALALGLASCGGSGGSGPAKDFRPQMVYMMPGASGGPFPPGPGSVPWEIAVMNLDGSGAKQLTSDGKFKFLPHFSPDGSKLVYAKYAVGGYGDPSAVMDAFVYDLAGGVETQITHSGNVVSIVWSPDGTRMAFISYTDSSLWLMNADGTNPQLLLQPSGAPQDLRFGDTAWSSDNWILFSVAQNVENCFKVRLDKIRPDGSGRTPVTGGGPNCTPQGFEQSGDADPGFSPDGQTIYSSRGLPAMPVGYPVPAGGFTLANAPWPTERKLYAFSSDAWTPGKTEVDLSLPAEPSCIEGVPKASPDGTRVLLFRICFDTGSPVGGIYLTDTAGSYRTYVTQGFGPDWNPVAP
jgi:Tol biopolymer transport system component